MLSAYTLSNISRIESEECRRSSHESTRAKMRLPEAEKALIKLNYKIQVRWRRRRAIMVIVSMLLGLIGGSAVAIEEVLRRHGPTVTIWGTLGALGIYLLSGIFLATILTILALMEAYRQKQELEKQKKLIEKEIKDLKNGIVECREKAETYSNMSIADRYRSQLSLS